MSDTTDELYDALADGTGEIPQDPRLVGAMRQKVAEAQKSDSVPERQRALAVAGAMAEAGGLDWLVSFASDPDVGIRRAALQAGVDAGEEGMPIVRAFLADPEPALSLRVLAILTERMDKTATTQVRALLGSTDSRVRGATAHLLGYIAGPVVRPQLSRLAESDPEASVRKTAAQALERIEGVLPRNNPVPWEPPRVPAAAPAPRPMNSQSIGPDTDIVPDRDAKAILIELGESQDPQAPGLLGELRGLSQVEVSVAISSYAVGGEPSYGIGAARAARGLDMKSAVSDLKRWLSDPNAGVRAAAAESLTDLGGPGVLMVVVKLLKDRSSDVKVGVIHGLERAMIRHDMGHMGESWIGHLKKHGNEAVAKAATDALERIKRL